MRATWKKLLLGAAVAGGVSAGSVFGAGFQLYTEGSAEAVALGGAISARRDLTSNVWYNPASITDFKSPRLMLGATIAKLGASYDGSGNPGDTDGDMESKWQLIPHIYYLHPLNHGTKTTLFLSLTSPYGLATDWDWKRNSWGPMLSEKMKLETFYLTGGAAYAVTNDFSIAAGISLVYANVDYKSRLPMVNPPQMELQGDAWGYAYSLAANYRFLEEWTVGVKYQSQVKLKFNGDATYSHSPFGANYDDGIDADVTLPATVTLGLATTAVPRWVFGFDVVWTDWSQYDQFRVNFDQSPLGANTPLVGVKNWRDALSYRLGAEYMLTEAWKLRFGYVYDRTPVRDQYRAPELPDSDRHMFSLGVGYETARWGADLSYCYVLMTNADSANGQLQGSYKDGYAHLIAASVYYKF